jgi:GNAT superfamily N-acetyltransferase
MIGRLGDTSRGRDGPKVGKEGPVGPVDSILLVRGEVAEWFMAAVLKTVDRKVRGFESLPLRRAIAADADAVADVYLASFRATLPSVRLAHDDVDVRRYVRDVLVAQHETWVAEDNGRVVAMMSLAPGWIEQLYVAPDRLGEGIGRRLLELAMRRARGDLQLWTFQVNERARRFYERNGFSTVEFTDGANNEESEPDVRYLWHRD